MTQGQSKQFPIKLFNKKGNRSQLTIQIPLNMRHIICLSEEHLMMTWRRATRKIILTDNVG